MRGSSTSPGNTEEGLLFFAVELPVVLFGCMDVTVQPTGEASDCCRDLTA